MSHRCHAIGCRADVPPTMLFCRRHWAMTPTTEQRAIWRTYRRGQEEDKTPSPAYVVAQRAAVNAVARAERRQELATFTLEEATVLANAGHCLLPNERPSNPPRLGQNRGEKT